MARFAGLDEGVLAAALKSTGYFSPFQFPLKGRAWLGLSVQRMKKLFTEEGLNKWLYVEIE